MNLSTSILLSAALISFVALYIATKDRWNWKKIILWPLVVLVILSILTGFGVLIYSYINGRPHIQNEFLNIPLNATKSDIKFKKGTPTETKDKDIWVYVSEKSYLGEKSTHVIFFKGNNIRSILYSGSYLSSNKLQGLGIGSTYETITKKFGMPSHISVSEDDLERIISFDKYKVFFSLREGKVDSYGIFNPKFGPMRFKKEKDAKVTKNEP